MTENDVDDQDEETEEIVTEPEPDVDEDDQPELADEEMADLEDVAEEIEAEAGAGAEDADQDVADEQHSETDAEAPGPIGADGTSVGSVYCNALGMGAAVLRTRHGSADESERQALTDEYGDMARQLDLDDLVDEWLAEQGGVDELTPGQAIVVSTAVFASAIAIDDPEMVDGLAEGVGA